MRELWVREYYHYHTTTTNHTDTTLQLVEKYGRFRNVRILQGFGFVDFDDYRDADDAVKGLDGRDFLGERYLVRDS